MSEKQNSNSHCRQLKLDWKMCQGTVEQPQLPNSQPWTCGLYIQQWTHTQHPHQFPKQTRHTQSVFPVRLHQGPGLSSLALGGRTDHSTVEVPDWFWARWCHPRSASCSLGCSALGEKSYKNKFVLRETQLSSNFLKCFTVNVFRNKPNGVSSFLFPL